MPEAEEVLATRSFAAAVDADWQRARRLEISRSEKIVGAKADGVVDAARPGAADAVDVAIRGLDVLIFRGQPYRGIEVIGNVCIDLPRLPLVIGNAGIVAIIEGVATTVAGGNPQVLDREEFQLADEGPVPGRFLVAGRVEGAEGGRIRCSPAQQEFSLAAAT